MIFDDFLKFVLIIINGHLRYVEVSWGSREAIFGHTSHFRPLPAKWSTIMRIIKNRQNHDFDQKFKIFQNGRKCPKNEYMAGNGSLRCFRAILHPESISKLI